MSHTFWLASPKYMLLFGIHPFEQSQPNQKVFKTLENSSTGTNILVHGQANGLPHLLLDRAYFIINSAYERNHNVIRRHRSFDIFVNKKDIDKFIQLVFQIMFGKSYVVADKILLRSARIWSFGMKLTVVLENYEARQKCLDVLIDVATACYIAALTNINIYTGLKNTATSITETAATNTATLGIESAAQVVGNAVAGAAISAIVDVAVSSAMIYVAKKHKDEGRISDEEFTIRIKKTVCESSCKFVGGTTGSILGQALIPVPVVGAFVGGFCGSLIGAGIGKGINYGVFDRKEKKQQLGTATEQRERVQSIRHVYGRRIRGYIPKIIIYNEEAKKFQEKHFQKTIKNYLKPSDTQPNVSSQTKHNEAIKPYLSRWKTKTLTPSDALNFSSKSTVAEKQLFVLSKWKKRSKSPEQTSSATSSVDSTESVTVPNETTEIKILLGDPDVNTNEVTVKSQCLSRPSEDFSRRASYKDRLSPNHLLKQVKSNIIRTTSNESSVTNQSSEESAKGNSTDNSPFDGNSPHTSFNDIPSLLNRLSFKSLRDSFYNINSSPTTSSGNITTSPCTPTKEFEQEILNSEKNDNSEEIEDQQTFTTSSLSRLRSFHSSIKERNRDKKKLSTIQKTSAFNSSIDAEGNVYDSKISSPLSSTTTGMNKVKNDQTPQPVSAPASRDNEEKEVFLAGITSRLLSFASINRRASSNSVGEDTVTNLTKTNNCHGDESKSSETNKDMETKEQEKDHFTVACKPNFFHAPLSSSLSETSSATSSPSTGVGSGNETSFSEREFDWWSRKLRQRFENNNNNSGEEETIGIDESNKLLGEVKTNIEQGSEKSTSNGKKEKKLLTTFKNIAKKLR